LEAEHMAAEKNALEGLRIDRDERESSGSRRGLWIAGAIVVLALAVATGWWLLRPRGKEVRTVAVRERAGGAAAAGTVLNASGYVTARRAATVSAKITGKVAEVLVEEGTVVKEGQVLARLDDATAQRAHALAEAQLGSSRRALAETEVRIRQAELQRQRLKKLAAQGISSQSDLDVANADADSLAAHLAAQREEVAVAERQVAVASQAIDDTIIRAPFAGIAVTKDAQPGEMISPVSAGGGFTRTGICTLVDMKSLEIDVDVNESYIHRVRPGQRAQAVLDAYPEWTIPAHVITVIPTADRQKATVKVRLGFEELDPRLLPDMGVKVAFLAGASERAAGAAPGKPELVVPRTAVRKNGDQDVVFVVQGGRAERRSIRLAPTVGDEAVVVAGLSGGEQVVVEGPPDLADGDAVRSKS
jgi:HlyD family secretion protein